MCIAQISRGQFEAVTASATGLLGGFHAIASTYGDYAKKSLEEGKAFAEKLSGAKSRDKALEMQTEFGKSGYETIVTESQKIARPLRRSRQAVVQAA